MPTRPRKTQVNWDNYQRSATGIRSFKLRLPEDSVKTLAEEVLVAWEEHFRVFFLRQFNAIFLTTGQ